jgi:MFS family permease
MTGSSTKQAGAPRWSALQRWTLGVTSMAAFKAGMDALVVTAALPTIHADLGAATSALSWTVAAYALGFAAVPRKRLARAFARRFRANVSPTCAGRLKLRQPRPCGLRIMCSRCAGF